MKYLLNNCPLFSSEELTARITEVDMMRCLRSSNTSNLEARMLITEPSRNEWRNRGHDHDSPGANKFHAGGFEVRRKDWESVLRDLESARWTKEWWSQRTVYMVSGINLCFRFYVEHGFSNLTIYFRREFRLPCV